MTVPADRVVTVLSVDDEPDVRALVRAVLEPAGYRVIEAGDGEGALAAIAAEPVDVILLDMRMPGMDGYQLLGRLHGRSSIPVVAVTGWSDPQALLLEARGGVVDHVAKPFTPAELEDAVEHALDRSGRELAVRGEALARSAGIHEAVLHLSEEIRSHEPPLEEHEDSLPTRVRAGLRRLIKL
jgi:CheY-like chemotaxis protein